MNIRNALFVAAALCVASQAVHAEVAIGTSAATLAADAVVGRAVVSSDGIVLGKVTSLKATTDGKGPVLYVSSPTDAKIFAIPSELAEVSAVGLTTKATSAELGKMTK